MDGDVVGFENGQIARLEIASMRLTWVVPGVDRARAGQRDCHWVYGRWFVRPFGWARGDLGR
jgi:hypothetical protein